MKPRDNASTDLQEELVGYWSLERIARWGLRPLESAALSRRVRKLLSDCECKHNSWLRDKAARGVPVVSRSAVATAPQRHAEMRPPGPAKRRSVTCFARTMPPTPLRSGGGSIEFDMALSLLAVERRIRTATRADETGRRGRVRSVRYGENPARREDPEKFRGPPRKQRLDFGKSVRAGVSQSCPVGACSSGRPGSGK